MKKYQVLYEMKVRGSIYVTAESEDDAERVVVEDVSYEVLAGEAGQVPEIEIDDVLEIKETGPQP